MFQKKHMDDLFGVIRENPSGMLCLTRFAGDQLMDGDVLFFNDVQGKTYEVERVRVLRTAFSEGMGGIAMFRHVRTGEVRLKGAVLLG